VAAVEDPTVAGDGHHVCFDDLAIARGYVSPADAVYLVDVSNGAGGKLSSFEQAATGPTACVPFDDTPVGDAYRVVSVRERLVGGAGKPEVAVGKASRVHLAWRESERKYVVVGMERDQ